MSAKGTLHHLELWVSDLGQSESAWGWLLERLGYAPYRRWAAGVSWRQGATYIVLEAGPDRVDSPHDRLRPGLNHVAFFAGSRGEVDEIVRAAPAHGWALLFPNRHPFAGGPEHYAAFLEDASGFEVELVAAED